MISGIRWALETALTAAEAEMNDDTALREQLLEAEMRREMGEISRRGVRRHRSGPAGPHPRDQGAPRGWHRPARDGRRSRSRRTADSRFQVEATVSGDFHEPAERSRTRSRSFGSSERSDRRWVRTGPLTTRRTRPNGPPERLERTERTATTPNDSNDSNDPLAPNEVTPPDLRLLPGSQPEAPPSGRASGDAGRQTGARAAGERATWAIVSSVPAARVRRGALAPGCRISTGWDAARWRTRRWSSTFSRARGAADAAVHAVHLRRARARARGARAAAHRSHPRPHRAAARMGPAADVRREGRARGRGGRASRQATRRGSRRVRLGLPGAQARPARRDARRSWPPREPPPIACTGRCRARRPPHAAGASTEQAAPGSRLLLDAAFLVPGTARRRIPRRAAAAGEALSAPGSWSR